MSNQQKYDYQAVYAWIIQYKQENDGNSPSYRQIMQQFGMTTPSVARHAVQALAAQGLVQLGNDVTGSILVTGGAWSLAVGHPQ